MIVNVQTIIMSVILGLNIFFTILFVIFFLKRFFKIKLIALTNKQCKDPHFLLRTIMNFLYVIVSFCALAFKIYLGVHQNDKQKQQISLLAILLSSQFFITSLILILHMHIVRMQLKKLLSTSHLHNKFFIYLLIVVIQQMGLTIYLIIQNILKTNIIITVVLVSIQLVDSLIMLILWQCKKKMMSRFDDVSNIDVKTVNDHILRQSILSTHTYSSRPISNKALKMTTQHWNLIVPTVLFQLGKIKIILQAYISSNVLNFLQQPETQLSTISQQLRKVSSKHSQMKTQQQQNIQPTMISNKQYTKQQIQKIYLTCNRFNNNMKIQFSHSVSDSQYYAQVKKFIVQLFQINAIYVPQILQLFSIDEQWINTICSKIRTSLKSNDQLLISTFVDHNAYFLSIQIFKQMYTHDHFIFYIHTVTIDSKDKAICWKRFSDFEEFHAKLQQTIREQIRSQYQLPAIPKKYFFSLKESDQEKVNQRRKQLQRYCRETFNDYEIMTKFPATKQLILQFLQLKNSVSVAPNVRKAIQFYQGLQIRKGKIYKAMLGEQYVTFYQFLLYQNKTQIRSIRKRFSQFKTFDLTLKKWMTNLQIVYKFVVLPQSHLYQSESKRHEKLIAYLEGVLSIKGIYKLYAANSFFSMGWRQQTEKEEPNRISVVRQQSDIQQNNDSRNAVEDEEVLSAALSTSLLIQRLGRQ